jgi:hypothetical protein
MIPPFTGSIRLLVRHLKPTNVAETGVVMASRPASFWRHLRGTGAAIFGALIGLPWSRSGGSKLELQLAINFGIDGHTY